jgi:transcriptional regulator with XRE-family HTH domain
MLAHQLGKRIQHLRVDQGLNQKTLALKIGATQAMVSQWELGNKLISTAYLFKICEVFNLKVCYFSIQEGDNVCKNSYEKS